VWLREPLAAGPIKAGLVTSLGFGHVAGLIALAHPQAFLEALDPADRERYVAQSRIRTIEGRLRLVRTMCGGAPAYQKPAGRRLGSGADSGGVRNLEASMLLDRDARLGTDGVYAGPGC
jgi:fatty acid synthase